MPVLDNRRPLLLAAAGLVLALPACSSDADESAAEPSATASVAASGSSAVATSPSASGTASASTGDEDGNTAGTTADLDPGCAVDPVSEAVCRFVLAVQQDDLSALNEAERGVASTVDALPDGPFTPGMCELVGDVTLTCEVAFDGSDGAEPAVVGLQVAPTDVEFVGDVVQPAPDADYEVVEYLGQSATASGR